MKLQNSKMGVGNCEQMFDCVRKQIGYTVWKEP